MKHSNKAARYLTTLTRDRYYIVSDRNEVIDYLTRQGVPAFEKVVDFQMEYSGLKLTIHNKDNAAFKVMLFGIRDLMTNAPVGHFEIDGRYYFYCGEHKTAPFPFVLGQDGEICIYNDDSVHTIYSSFEKFIETYVMQNTLAVTMAYEHPPYYDLLDSVQFTSHVRSMYTLSTANDEYNEWLLVGDLMIYKGTWLYKPSFFVHVYGETEEQCEAFIKVMKDNKIIE